MADAGLDRVDDRAGAPIRVGSVEQEHVGEAGDAHPQVGARHLRPGCANRREIPCGKRCEVSVESHHCKVIGNRDAEAAEVHHQDSRRVVVPTGDGRRAALYRLVQLQRPGDVLRLDVISGAPLVDAQPEGDRFFQEGFSPAIRGDQPHRRAAVNHPAMPSVR